MTSYPPFAGVERIAVLRGGGIGDLVLALPAIAALARTYPRARIVLLGTPAHRALLRGRPGPVDRVEVLPPAEGVYAPAAGSAAPAAASGPSADRQAEVFFAAMRAVRFDLACQLHGGGRFSNPFLRGLHARHTVGARTADADRLERTVPYVYYQHEIMRWLEVVALAGAATDTTEPMLTATAAERTRRAGAGDTAGRPLIVLHPGATDPRRRWPVGRFVALARRARADGCTVVTVGSGPDAAVAREVAVRADVACAPGSLSLSGLVALLCAASGFVGNDSGPRHVAQALGTPTVGVFWVGNVINGAPLTRTRHRVQMSWTTRCPVCGRDVTQVGWTAQRCAHDESFVADVTVDAVYADLRDVMRSRP